MIVVSGQLTIRPDQRDRAVAAASALMTATRAEPGCAEYMFSTDIPAAEGQEARMTCVDDQCKRAWRPVAGGVELGEGLDPVVLDAKQLLLDPPGVLRGACDRLGITFHESMLRWPAGPKPQDGVWAKHWYANVHASTGFSPYRPRSGDFPSKLRPLLEESLPLYERLRGYAIPAG